MLDKISKNSFFDSIENIKGIGPKTSKLFEKLCGDRVIDLLLTIPRVYKKRKYIQNISDEYFKQESTKGSNKYYKEFCCCNSCCLLYSV